jgi:hypothetical protein
MKKLSIFSALLVGAFLFAACDADRDDNPVLDLTKTQDPITMNTPTFAGGFYDLQNTDTIFFACTAPNYGFPATVTYALQVSIDEDMSNPTRLTTTYSKNGMDVASREVAIGVTKQMMDKKQLKQEDFPVETPIYMRIHAYIDGVEGTDTYSNVVKFNKVKTGFALPDVEMPEQLYVMGDFTENNWEKAVPTTPVNGATSVHWRIAWINKNGIQTSPVKDVPNYADDYITVSYKSKTAGFNVDETGKITADTEGWYTMIIESKCDNDKRTMELTFSFEPAEVWLIGTSIANADAVGKDGTKGIFAQDDAEKGIIANCWKEKDLRENFTEYVKFETPTTMDGEFVSPALTSAVVGDGGTRAYVKVKSYDWWKSEFFVFEKKIVYRGNGGDQERVNGYIGQKVRLKFSDDTGELKK